MNNIDISTGSFPEDKQKWVNGHRQWCPEELEILDAHFKEKPEQTANYLQRSVKSCKAKYYQLHRKERPSAIDIQKMRRMKALGMTFLQIAESSGFSYGQVTNILSPKKR